MTGPQWCWLMAIALTACALDPLPPRPKFTHVYYHDVCDEYRWRTLHDRAHCWHTGDVRLGIKKQGKIKRTLTR